MRSVLLSIGAVILFGVTCMVAALIHLGYKSRQVGQAANAIKPGMTIEQAVAVFPTTFLSAHMGVPARTVVCKDSDGRLVPPEEDTLFPDMEESDKDGERLARDARELPLRLDRIELLDKHLRGREDWQRLVKVWTAYIQNREDHAEPVSFFRRGTAYLALNDFKHGYEDVRKACKSGSREGCAKLGVLEKDKVAAFEAERQRVLDKAPACEPSVSSFALRRSEDPDKFNLQVYAPQSTEPPRSEMVSRGELAELFKREFAGREWQAGFTFLTGTPQSLSFHFVVGRDGMVKEVSPVRGRD